MNEQQALKILLLGGYGNAGQAIARLLLQEFSGIEIVIAGRSLAKAETAANRLNEQFLSTATPKVTAQSLHAARPGPLIAAFSQVDLVINAASTIPHTRQVVEAAIQAQTDYIDTQLSSPEKWKVLEEQRDRIQGAGICYVTDGGFHPGVPAALVRYAAAQMEEVESAFVYGGLRIDWGSYQFSPATVKELVDEFKHFKPLIFQDGRWQKQSFRKLPVFDFGDPLGAMPCTPMDMREMHLLPEAIPALRQTGFYVSGFNPIADNLILPLVYPAIKLLPKSWSTPFARLFHWSLKFSKPPYGLNLTAVCRGKWEGRQAALRLSLIHEDGYVLTAVPVVAFVHQWRSGRIRRPGLWMQAQIVEPELFLRDVERMGVKVKKAFSSEGKPQVNYF